MAEVKANFRPEFVNRIDEIVVFQPLSDKQIAEIARIQLKYLEARLAKLDIRLDVQEAALAAVAAAGFDPVYGARPLKRAIQQQIENPLAKRDPGRAATRPATRQRRRDRWRDHVRQGRADEEARQECEGHCLTRVSRRARDLRDGVPSLLETLGS